MKRVCFLVLFLLVNGTFVLALGTTGDFCVDDDDCYGQFLCAHSECTTPSTSVPYVPAESTSSYICRTTDDCISYLGDGYACDSTSSCSEDLDYNDYADIDESTDSSDTCVTHNDCVLGDVCDFTTYICTGIDVVSIGTCQGSSQCNESYVCYHRYCIPEETGGETDAGITPDNPFLGSVDAFVDTVRGGLSNNPQVQQRIAQEALGESQQIDQRKAQGILSDKTYAYAKDKAGQRSVQGIERTYIALSQQSNEDDNSKDYNPQIHKLNALVNRADRDLANFQVSSGKVQYSQGSDQLRSQLNTAEEQFYSGGQKNQQQGQTYTCDEILADTYTDTLLVSPLKDGSFSLTDDQGTSYSLSLNGNEFMVSGSNVRAYFKTQTYSGNEIVFIPASSGQGTSSRAAENVGSRFGQNAVVGTGNGILSLFTGFAIDGRSSGQQGSLASSGRSQTQNQEETGSVDYDAYVDGQYIETVDFNVYGKSIIGLGNSVLYNYDGQSLILEDSVLFSIASGTLKGCQLNLASQQQDQLGQEREQRQLGDIEQQETFASSRESRIANSTSSQNAQRENELGTQQNSFATRLRDQQLSSTGGTFDKQQQEQGQVATQQQKTGTTQPTQNRQQQQLQGDQPARLPSTGQAVSNVSLEAPVFLHFLFFRD